MYIRKNHPNESLKQKMILEFEIRIT